METKYVKIVRCSKPTYWYKNLIGAICPVTDIVGTGVFKGEYEVCGYGVVGKDDSEPYEFPKQEGLTEKQRLALLDTEKLLNFLNADGTHKILTEAFPEVFKPAVTYKVGDRIFIDKDPCHQYLLAQVAPFMVVAINMISGNRRADAVRVKSIPVISEEELALIVGEHTHIDLV